jgi:hypothetical protein
VNPELALELKPMAFRYKASPDVPDLGVMVEDVEALGLDILVLKDKDGQPDAFRYDKLPLLHNELLKQYQFKISDLEEANGAIRAQLQQQKTEMERQQAELDELKRMMAEITAAKQ